jgi:hypothetical protein
VGNDPVLYEFQQARLQYRDTLRGREWKPLKIAVSPRWRRRTRRLDQLHHAPTESVTSRINYPTDDATTAPIRVRGVDIIFRVHAA